MTFLSVWSVLEGHPVRCDVTVALHFPLLLMMAFMVFHVACNVLDVSVRRDGEIQYVPCKLTTRRRRQETPTEGMIFSWIHFLHHKNLQFEQCRVYSILYFIFIIIIIRFVKKKDWIPCTSFFFLFHHLSFSFFFFFLFSLYTPPAQKGMRTNFKMLPVLWRIGWRWYTESVWCFGFNVSVSTTLRNACELHWAGFWCWFSVYIFSPNLMIDLFFDFPES